MHTGLEFPAGSPYKARNLKLKPLSTDRSHFSSSTHDQPQLNRKVGVQCRYRHYLGLFITAKPVLSTIFPLVPIPPSPIKTNRMRVQFYRTVVRKLRDGSDVGKFTFHRRWRHCALHCRPLKVVVANVARGSFSLHFPSPPPPPKPKSEEGGKSNRHDRPNHRTGDPGL